MQAEVAWLEAHDLPIPSDFPPPPQTNPTQP
jgi:hypothetical protein